MSTKAQNGLLMIHTKIDAPLLKRLDDYRWKHRIESRSEALRELMRLALDAKLTPNPNRQEKV